MGMNLWGESPLYENLKVFIVVMDTNKSTSRRQGRLREEGSIRLSNDQAYSAAVGGYESLLETQSQQHLMIFSVAPFVETWRVSTQKSAEGMVVPGDRDEGPNVEKSEAVSQVLSPAFDPHFSESSFGFRPGRSAHQAVQKVLKDIQRGYAWAVDIDPRLRGDRLLRSSSIR
jgi:hypothetical protein